MHPEDLGIGTLFYRIREAVIVADVETNLIVLWNPGAERLFGYSTDEAVGQPPEILVPDRYKEYHRTGITNYQATGHGRLIDSHSPVELEALHKGGDEIAVELTLTPLEQISPAGKFVLALVRDATQRRSAEEERARRMHEQLARIEAEATQRRTAFLLEAGTRIAGWLDYQMILDELARVTVSELADWSAVYVYGEDGELRLAAAAHEESRLVELLWRLDGYAPSLAAAGARHPELSQEIGEADLQTLAPDPAARDLLRSLGLASLLVVPLPVRDRPGGALLMARRKAERSYQATDLALAVDLAYRTGLALDNARLHEAAQEALRLREEFLSVASHELKTPITAAQLALGRLERKARQGLLTSMPPEQLQRILAVGLQQMVQLGDLVERMLSMGARGERGISLERQEVNLVELLRETVELIEPQAEAAGCAIEVAAEGTVRGLWDGGRLKQVIINLLTNAIKFGRGAPVLVTLTSREGWAILEVSDHGPGIAQEDMERIFEPFARAASTRNFGGLGLGLYISRDIVTAHGGKISVRSQAGAGATFMVSLPVPEYS